MPLSRDKGILYIYMYVYIYICRSIHTYTHARTRTHTALRSLDTLTPYPRMLQPSRMGSCQAGTGQGTPGRIRDLGVPEEWGTHFLCSYRSASPFHGCTPWDSFGWQQHRGEVHCSAGTVPAGHPLYDGKFGDSFPKLAGSTGML